MVKEHSQKNETDVCLGCGTGELRKMIGGLVEKLVGEKRVEVVVDKKSVVVVEEKGKGVLYRRLVNGKWGWYKSGNEKKDWKYVGEIEEGIPNGKGTHTWSDGGKYVGEFKNGKRWNGTRYDTDGKIISKYVKGKRIKQ